jgi:hypothetical protein
MELVNTEFSDTASTVDVTPPDGKMIMNSERVGDFERDGGDVLDGAVPEFTCIY